MTRRRALLVGVPQQHDPLSELIQALPRLITAQQDAEVSDLITLDDEPYLNRAWLHSTPTGNGPSARIHRVVRSDSDRWPHDHPWDFVSVILEGQYVETVNGRDTLYERGAVLARTAETAHQLTLVDGEACTTFVITGPVRRPWGYHTSNGWRGWRAMHADALRTSRKW